jgi:hypothetical protein
MQFFLYIYKKINAMKKILTLLLAVGLTLSCSDDDDNSADALNGTWNMITFAQYSSVPPPQLTEGDVTWTISGGTLTVVNNVEEEYPQIWPPSGQYAVQVNNNDITIDGEEFDDFYRHSFVNDVLILNQGEEGLQDGNVIQFTEADVP